jgi:hypothetical protein
VLSFTAGFDGRGARSSGSFTVATGSVAGARAKFRRLLPGGAGKRYDHKIVRFFLRDYPKETLQTGLTLEEAQAHCASLDTSSRTCTHPDRVRLTEERGEWFDGYYKEEP